tara:strand:+ start:294 stop:593 length:300 start_codon:yes stop_codon:yes gene_type:complete
MKLLLENWREYIKEEVQRVPLDKIVPTEELGYLKYEDPEEFEEVVTDIEHAFEMGKEDPLDVVYDEATDMYEIVDGHHRFHVASEWGFDDYPVNVVNIK